MVMRCQWLEQMGFIKQNLRDLIKIFKVDGKITLKGTTQLYTRPINPQKVDKMLNQGTEAYSVQILSATLSLPELWLNGERQKWLLFPYNPKWRRCCTNTYLCSENSLNYLQEEYWITKFPYNQVQHPLISEPTNIPRSRRMLSRSQCRSCYKWSDQTQSEPLLFINCVG